MSVSSGSTACPQTFSPPLITAALTSIFGTAADVHRVSSWLPHFGGTAPASDGWPWCILLFVGFLDVSVDTGCLAGTGRWPGDGQREEGSWTGESSPVICGMEKNPLKADSIMTTVLCSLPMCQLGTNHCHVQQVVDLQLLVDTPPVLLHLFLFLPGLLKISLVDGTLLFHVVPGQTLSHLKSSQQGRSLSVSWYLLPAILTAYVENNLKMQLFRSSCFRPGLIQISHGAVSGSHSGSRQYTLPCMTAGPLCHITVQCVCQMVNH